MIKRDIIVVGASAGGVEALKQLVKGLPADLPAAIFVVLHVSEHGISVLPRILQRAGNLPAVHAVHGQTIEHGHIYVAPPNHHMLVKNDHIDLSFGPRENGCRPAVDVLFRTAARAYGQRVVGVVLSGMLDDGSAGLVAITSRKGISVVQDPDEALYSGMPNSAIEQDHVYYVLPLNDISALIVRLANEPILEEEVVVPEKLDFETDIAELRADAIQTENRPGKSSLYGCPDCGGILWEIEEGNLLRYRCRVGHSYTAQHLLLEQSQTVEEAFWVALRALEENASLARRLGEGNLQLGNHKTAERFADQAQTAEAHAKTVRDVLLNGYNSKTKDTVEE